MQRRARGLEDGKLGGGDHRPGPAAGDRALGGTAAARAVVDMPYELAAQGRADHQLVVTGEAGDARAGAGLHDGEGRARALDLTGGGGEQLPGGGQVHAEDRGDLVGGEVVAYGEFERLALLRGGAGGLRPGQQGQFTPTPLLGLLGDGRDRLPLGVVPARRVGGLTFLLGLGQLAQTCPAGQRVQPGPAVPGGLRTAAALGEREDVTEGGGGRVVVAQYGQAVGEQAVQIRLVARRRALRQRARRTAVARLPLRPVRAGGAGRGLRTAAHHPWTVGCGRQPLLPP